MGLLEQEALDGECPMKVPSRLFLGLALLFAPVSSHAISIPLPTTEATLNLDLLVQPQFVVNEASTPDGRDPSYDVFLRRARISLGGNVGQNFSYFFQLDSPNFGKASNFTGRLLVQDAWFGWAPTGIVGGTVVYLEAGMLYVPVSRPILPSPPNLITTGLPRSEEPRGGEEGRTRWAPD